MLLNVIAYILFDFSHHKSSADVFIIAATNRPDLVDPALLRPGRLDKLIYLGISADKEDQRRIFRALTRKFHFAKAMDEEAVIARCPLNMTGADFYALCADAMLRAMKRAVAKVEAAEKKGVEKDRGINLKTWTGVDPNGLDGVHGQGVGKEHDSVELLLYTEDFLQALEVLSPSVSEAELRRYESLRDQMMRK